jgi:hypothetical protein
VQLDAAVQRGLAAKAQQHGAGSLLFDDLLDELGGHRDEVHLVGQIIGGLDRGHVGIDEHGAQALFLERLDRLAARVIELAGLADLERRAAQHQHAERRVSRIAAHGIAFFTRSLKSSKIQPVSTGPGWASGWNCTL